MRCGLRAYLKNGKQEENGEARGIGRNWKKAKKGEDENGMMKWKGRTLKGKEGRLRAEKKSEEKMTGKKTEIEKRK